MNIGDRVRIVGPELRNAHGVAIGDVGTITKVYRTSFIVRVDMKPKGWDEWAFQPEDLEKLS